MGNFVAVVIAVALIVENLFKLLHTVFASSVKAEQITYHRCLALVYDKALVLFLVSEDTAVAKYNA